MPEAKCTSAQSHESFRRLTMARAIFRVGCLTALIIARASQPNCYGKIDCELFPGGLMTGISNTSGLAWLEIDHPFCVLNDRTI
jgi:hypothetical protein